MAVTTLFSAVTELLGSTGDGFASTTDSAGSASTLVDSTIQDTSEPSTSYNGAWVRPTAGSYADQQRRVTTGGYDDTTGTLTFGRPYAGTFGSGVGYQLSTKLSFDDLKVCVNWALQRAYYEDTVVYPATGMQQYPTGTSLPTWIASREHIITIRRRQGNTPDNYTYLPVRWWGVEETAGATPGTSDPVLKFIVNPIVPSNENIVVHAYHKFDTVTAGTDTTSMALDWLTAGAEWKYYDLLVRRGGKGDVARYEDLRKQCWAKWTGMLRKRQPLRNSDMQFADPWIRAI